MNADLSAIRLAIVEDCRPLREHYIETIQTEVGCQVAEAEDGQVGFGLIQSWKPHLILCDVLMPRLDGPGLLCLVRQQPRLHRTLIIMLSSFGQDYDAGLFTAGADDVLQKPFTIDELADAVTAWARVALLQGPAACGSETP